MNPPRDLLQHFTLCGGTPRFQPGRRLLSDSSLDGVLHEPDPNLLNRIGAAALDTLASLAVCAPNEPVALAAFLGRYSASSCVSQETRNKYLLPSSTTSTTSAPASPASAPLSTPLLIKLLYSLELAYNKWLSGTRPRYPPPCRAEPHPFTHRRRAIRLA